MEPVGPDCQCLAVGVELAGVEPSPLRFVVERDDRSVRRCREARRLPSLRCLPPGADGGSLHAALGAAAEATSLLVLLDDRVIAAAEPEARLRLPWLGEAMDPTELDGVEGVDEVTEHAGATHGGELQGVADEHEPPGALLGQLEQLGEALGRHHRRLVHDDGGAGGEVIEVVGWPVEAMLHEQLVDGVGVNAAVDAEDFRRRRRWCDTEDDPPFAAQLVDGGPEGRGLAGAGGTDGEDE